MRATNQKKKTVVQEIPTRTQLEEELKRERYQSRFFRTLRSTVYGLITVAAAAVLVATLWLPVLRIYGSSMTPTLSEGDIVVSVKTAEFQTGDIVSFYFNNKILVKRVIAGPGDWVSIDENGVVSVNRQQLSEPYVADLSIGECDLEFPYQVPESRYFVLGDHRSTSVDSRSSAVGCVSEEQIVGKIVFHVWPLTGFGSVQ